MQIGEIIMEINGKEISQELMEQAVECGRQVTTLWAMQELEQA